MKEIKIDYFSRGSEALVKAIMSTLFIFMMKLGVSQQIIWGEADEHDNPNMPYEIIGRFDSSYLIYKSAKNSNYICVYNEDMQVAETHELEFLPSRMLDIDVIKNKQNFTIIWQQQKNGIVSCYGTVMNANMQQVVPVQLLDTTKIGQFADSKIYLTGYSEDKTKLLVYKRYLQKGDIRVMAKVYDNRLNMLDSSRFAFDFKSKKDFLSESVIDNEGNVYFTAQHRSASNQTYASLGLFICRKGVGVKQVEIPLQDKRLLQSSLAVDNNHKRCIITADYSQFAKYRSDGIYICYVDATNQELLQQHFVAFSDSLKTLLKPSGANSYDEADYHPDFVLIKKNGSVVIVKEDAYEETVNAVNPWNNNMMMGNPGVFSPVDYYYSPYQNSFYNRNMGRARTRFYNNNIHIIQIDSSLRNQWLRVVSKNQYAEDDDSFNSYFMLMQSKELHMVFLGNISLKHVVSHVGVGGDGSVHRYPTFRGNGSAVEMLPRYAKQTSWNTCIMPYIESDKLAFAKVVF